MKYLKQLYLLHYNNFFVFFFSHFSLKGSGGKCYDIMFVSSF